MVEIKDGPIGAVGHYDFKFEGMKLIAEATAGVPVGEMGVVVKLDSRAVLRAIAAKIPGVWDDAAIELAIQALERL